ncbi:hypothetical protein H0H92_004786 [Tricholoma furcatifolium]|nr:hypothetical protein H0H92_004786 [Tricholoma furcatifolium]
MTRFLSLDSLNRYMPNFNLTLASHNEFSRSPTPTSISPLHHINNAPRLALRPVFDESDDHFQSNAQLSLSGTSSLCAGLGISYPHISQSLVKADPHNADKLPENSNTSCFPPRVLSGSTSSLQGELGCFYDQRLGIALTSSWPPSLVPGELSSSVLCNSKSFDSDADPSKDESSDTLSSLASASGMSIDILAGKLSATAHLALELMSSNSSGTLGSSSSGLIKTSLLEEFYDVSEPSWTRFSPLSSMSDHPGLQANSLDPLLGTDPSEIMTKHLPDADCLLLQLPETCLTTPFSKDENYLMDDTSTFSTTAEDRTAEENAPYFQVLVSELNFKYDYDSDYKPEVSDSDHEDNGSSSSFPSPCQKTRARKNAKRSKRSTRTANSTAPQFRQRIRIITKALDPPTTSPKQEVLINIDFGTPVLDAHRGISLDDLMLKAERYRLRNPGQPYDKNWLASFAGKLTERGELMGDFRCYVSGCTQTNKRRDHILIHMGSHLDQRPFPCAYCPSRFLRKNECKRHEASHSGVKPFLCETCDSAFVRQDLLKRHTARAHGIKLTQSRKRKPKSDIVKGEDKENISLHHLKRAKQEST